MHMIPSPPTNGEVSEPATPRAAPTDAVEAVARAQILIGAAYEDEPEAVKQSNRNEAWWILNTITGLHTDVNRVGSRALVAMPAPEPTHRASSDEVERGKAALTRLANTRMDLSLEDWCTLSADILAAMSPSQSDNGEG